jgi:hypothetical protein
MDIAAFVGFAARGPIGVPVVIEAPAHFQDIFGDPPLLAWDAETEMDQTACLGLAVRDFFAQGGQRCWVVRVAGNAAKTNHFPIAGLLHATPTDLLPASVQARSPGSWSDGLQVSATLLVEPLYFTAQTLPVATRLTVDLGVLTGPALQPGDLVQLDFADAQHHRGYLHLEHVVPGTPDGETTRIFAATGAVTWFRPLLATEPLTGVVEIINHVETRAAATLDFSTRTLTVAVPAYLVSLGAWLRFRLETDVLWLLVDQVGTTQEGMIHIVVAQEAWWQGPASTEPLLLERATRVTLALAARHEQGQHTVLADLACGPPHPRYLGYLPDDVTLYRSLQGEPEPADGQPGTLLWPAVTHPRFPLAGPSTADGWLLPLGLRATPVAWSAALPVAGLSLERDGLLPTGANPATVTGAQWATFVEEIYLDPGLRAVGQASLLAEAFDRRFIQRHPLQGLHSVLPLEEVSLLALPDLAQRGWRLITQIAPPPPEPVAPPPPARACPGHDLFQPKVIPHEAEPITPGAATGATTAAIPVNTAGTVWELLPPAAYDPTGLLTVQNSAADLAAARADLVILLALPAHFRSQDALQHRQNLGRTWQQSHDATGSYAALYHPWLITRDAAGVLRSCSPEGAISGLIAARTLTRGAWVAPANCPVRDTLALTPLLESSFYVDLYNGNVNLIRRDAGEFMLWGADTLSADPELQPLNVRRLLILLRRIVLREGQTYVFAPHSPAFRRRVARQLERQLAELFARGAFTGSDPRQAYRVVVEETLNTPASVEQGRFIVELRIAPAQPLAFITVRLIQTSTETFSVQEGVSLA